jgi:hypothetical protein
MKRVGRGILYAIMLMVLTPTAIARNLSGGELRGEAELSSLIGHRLLAHPAKFRLRNYLKDDDGLASLLGQYSSKTPPFRFLNGAPNAMNMMLYRAVFTQVAKEIALNCDPPKKDKRLALQTEFSEQMKIVCKWPAPSARTTDVLRSFWTAIQGPGSDAKEFTAFQNFFQSPEFSSAPARSTVEAMLLAAFLNPHFLLEK